MKGSWPPTVVLVAAPTAAVVVVEDEAVGWVSELGGVVFEVVLEELLDDEDEDDELVEPWSLHFSGRWPCRCGIELLAVSFQSMTT